MLTYDFIDIIRHDELTPRSKWVPSVARSNCAMCNERFSVFRHRHHCRTCGDLVCMNCYTKKVTLSPTSQPERIIVCVLCLAKRERQFLFNQVSPSPRDVDFNHPFNFGMDPESSHISQQTHSKKKSKPRFSILRYILGRT